MGFSTYSIMMTGASKAHLFQLKKQVVQWAQAHGIRDAVRKWGVGRNTVRRWLRRFQEEGNEGLLDKRKGPHSIPHKTSKTIEEKVIEARQEAPCYGARRLYHFLEIKS